MRKIRGQLWPLAILVCTFAGIPTDSWSSVQGNRGAEEDEHCRACGRERPGRVGDKHGSHADGSCKFFLQHQNTPERGYGLGQEAYMASGCIQVKQQRQALDGWIMHA